MNVEMNFCALLSFSTFLLLSTPVFAQDESTTVLSDNVVTDTETQSAPESKLESEPETTPNAPSEFNGANRESDDNNSKEIKSVKEDSVNPTQEYPTPGLNEVEKLPEAKLAAEERIADQQENVTLPPNEGIQDTEGNAKDVEPLIGENVIRAQDNTTPAPEGEILPTDDKTLLKTLSGMTDRDKVKQLEEGKNEAGTSVENQGGNIENIPDIKDQLEPKGNETKIESEDQEQQEVNIVFPTNNPNKEDEFERMAKQIKPIKVPDEQLAKKLAGDYGEHIDHNKEDEQPDFIFPTQHNKSDQEESVKIEPESEISGSEEKNKSGDESHSEAKRGKDVRIALPTTSTEENNDKKSSNIFNGTKDTLKTKPQQAMILNESEEQQPSIEPTPQKAIIQEELVKSSEENVNENANNKKIAKEDTGVKKVKGNNVTLKKDKIESSGKNNVNKPTGTEQKNDTKETIHKKDKSQNKNKSQIKDDAISKEQHSQQIPQESADPAKEKSKALPHEKTTPPITSNKGNDHIKLNKLEKETQNNIPRENTFIGKKYESSEKINSGENKDKKSINIYKDKSKQEIPKKESSKTKLKSSKADAKVDNAHKTLTEEELIKNAMKFENIQPATTESPTLKLPNSVQGPTQANQTKPEDDGTNINTTLVFAEIIFRHGDRYKGIDPEETYPNDPYAMEDPFWLPYGCDQLRNKGKMRTFWLGQYLRRRYAGFLPEEFYHNDVRMTSADVNRCIDSAHVMTVGLYPPKGINIWNDNVGKYYQPIPVRTLHPDDDIFLNEEVTCPPYEKELKNVLTKKMKNFNKKYQYMYEYLEMYAGMPVKNLEDVAQVYTTIRIENENGRKLPDWVNLVFPTHLKMLNSYYNQIRYSSHFFKRVQAGPLLTILMDELKQKSFNRLKPNYKMKFWSGFDTTILKLLYTMKETQPSLDKAEDLLETDYSGVLIIEMHLINKEHFVKVLYINMDPSFWKSHTPRPVQICDGLTLCPLEKFLAKMEKFRTTKKQWFQQCNISYCNQEDQPDNSIKLRVI